MARQRPASVILSVDGYTYEKRRAAFSVAFFCSLAGILGLQSTEKSTGNCDDLLVLYAIRFAGYGDKLALRCQEGRLQ